MRKLRLIVAVGGTFVVTVMIVALSRMRKVEDLDRVTREIQQSNETLEQVAIGNTQMKRLKVAEVS